MVYYPSTPVIPKSENPSQAQLCAPLQLATTSPLMNIPTLEQAQSNGQGHYYINRNITVMQKLHQEKAPQNTSIGQIYSLDNVPNSNFHTNIKAEIATANIIPGSPSTLTSIAVPNLTHFNNAESNTTPVLGAPAVRRRAPPAKKAQFKCEQCGMMFGSKSAHTSHTKSHGKSGGDTQTALSSNTAAVIDTDSTAPLGIPKTPHIKMNSNNGGSGGDPYQCNVCQKTFAVPARLIRHYRTHTGERPFECEFCHKLFSVKENLQVHRRIHTKERPYKCDVCGRAFEHSGKLHRHMRIHTGERPHKCSVCEKTFIQSGQLVIHMRTHTGEKPYKCPVEGCGKGFTCSKQLKVHSRTHTGEKPYHCDICFRDFGYNHVLKLHRVQHYGSKCYKCTICEETFKSKKEMEAHIKGHANDDDDDEAVSNEAPTTSNGSSGSVADPPAATTFEIAKTTKRRKAERKSSTVTIAASPLAKANSPMPSMSPSPTTSLSISMTSRISPVSSAESHADSPAAILATEETDYRNHHSTEDDILTMSSNYENSSTSTTIYSSIEEMPTDLSIQQEPPQKRYQQQSREDHSNSVYLQPHYEEQHQQHQPQTSYYVNNVSYRPTHNAAEQLTINPALLEAASIASRCVILEPREAEVTQAALQIMQLNRSQQQYQQQQQQIIQPVAQSAPSLQQLPASAAQQQNILISSNVAHYDDTKEANDLIRHYKRGELAQHGIHKGYAPVPKFESSLLNNEIIVRQVEAAIAPLRSSTESPERSSSPESDSMMMADRDVMTLPLRKRKLYMSDAPKCITAKDKSGNGQIAANASSNGGAGAANTSSNSEIGTRVMRLSSVIQFAKAS